jgi:glycosyltransferase involved in cell wall biosynthesis
LTAGVNGSGGGVRTGMRMAFNVDYDHLEITGIGRYGLELVRAWQRNGLYCELWMNRTALSSPPDLPGGADGIRYYPWPRRITDRFWPSRRARMEGIEWVHSANCMLLPGNTAFGQVTMVHDMGPFLFGHMKADEDTLPWRARLRDVAARADCIMVNSKSTMEDLLEVFPGVGDRVFVTPLGIDHFPPGRESSSRDHILSVGTVEPRKNVDGLVRAYSILRGRRSVPPLVIAGMDGFRADEYRKLVRDLSLGDSVTFTGYISDTRLAELYGRALCLVHPAHHEGFGFTVPEAFSWELPVVASDTAGLAEYFTGAVWMVDPADPESIAHGIEMAMDRGITEEQAERRAAIRAELTWKGCADETRRILESPGVSDRACRRSGGRMSRRMTGRGTSS